MATGMGSRRPASLAGGGLAHGIPPGECADIGHGIRVTACWFLDEITDRHDLGGMP